MAPESIPSGAKAHDYFMPQMYGLKPVPFNAAAPSEGAWAENRVKHNGHPEGWPLWCCLVGGVVLVLFLPVDEVAKGGG